MAQSVEHESLDLGVVTRRPTLSIGLPINNNKNDFV